MGRCFFFISVALEVIGPDRFVLVHLDAPIEVCRERNPQKIYSHADAGEVGDLPGYSSPYAVPERPDLYLDTAKSSIDECVGRLIELLESRGTLSA